LVLVGTLAHGVLAQVKNGNKQFLNKKVHAPIEKAEHAFKRAQFSFLFFGFWVMGQSKWLLPDQKKQL
jgi:hypothetical protein